MQKKKKVVIVGPAYPYRGGNSLYVSFVYDILKDNFDVKVINYKLLYPKILFPGTTQKDISGFIIKNVPNKRIINSVNPFSWFKTATEIRKENPDLIIFDWWNPFFGPSHFVISKLLKGSNKILFITENVISHEGRFVDKHLTKLGLKNADCFLSLSNKVEATLKNLYPEKKVYRSSLPIYDCYRTDNLPDKIKIKQSLGFKEDEIILLFFGYVRKYKGLNILIDAMPGIIKGNPLAKLLIVGEFYDSSEKYFKQIETLGISDYVKVVEKFVPNEDVGIYYTASDVVILPYLEATQSGVLNIAYGFGKPVIVSNVGGLAEDVDQGLTGYIIESGNPSSIADAVSEFCKSRAVTDFENNIKNKLSGHMFNKMPALIETIIKDDK